MSRVLAVIPARFGSTRFPGKPLVKIGGREMVLRVLDQVSQCRQVTSSVVATDDQRIFDLVVENGYEAMMTDSSHQTGTDRLVEVAQSRPEEYILNVQGDEPFVNPRHLDLLIEQWLASGKEAPMATLNRPPRDLLELQSPNTVKSLVAQTGMALYFSRAVIPYSRDTPVDDSSVWPHYLVHIGVYLYRRDFLLRFPMLPPSRIERIEKLEQLRALDHGHGIYCVQVEDSSPGIDTPEDLRRAEAWLQEQGRTN